MAVNLYQKYSYNKIALSNSYRVASAPAPVHFKSNQVNDTFNIDSVDLSTKKNKKNILLKIGSAAATVVIGTIVIKKCKESYIKKAQKTFQEVFLRNDITQEDTIKMLKRYKDIQKLKKTDTRENYIKAMFEEAKTNYGFKDRPITLTFKDGSTKTERGSMSRDNSVLNITPNCNIRNVMNTIHHEFRHAKQHEICVNYSPKTRMNYLVQILKHENMDNQEIKKLFDTISDEIIDKNGSIPLNEIYEKFCQDVRVSSYLEKYFGKISPDNIKRENEEYAKKLVEAFDNYKSPKEDSNAYWENFTEKDARNAGKSIEGLFGLMSKIAV